MDNRAGGVSWGGGSKCGLAEAQSFGKGPYILTTCGAVFYRRGVKVKGRRPFRKVPRERDQTKKAER